MTTLLVKNIHTLVTMDAARREILNAALYVRDNVIEQVGTTSELPQTADEILDLQGRYVVSDESIVKFGQTGTGVAHCPCSNMRLASGIAPVRKMLNQGVPVGLGVDGAASNDASNLLHEARTAFLLARVGSCDASVMTARDVLELATVGGARVLGRDDVGYLAPGMSADFIAFNIDRPYFAGAHHDIVAALIFCQANVVDYSFINGKKIVDAGHLTTVELETLVEKNNKLAQRMVNG